MSNNSTTPSQEGHSPEQPAGFAFFDEAPEPMCVLNSRAVLLFANKAFKGCFGEDSTGKNLADFLAEQTNSVLNYLKSASQEKTTTFEMSMRTVAARERQMRVSIRSLANSLDENSPQLIANFSDITEWNNAQIALIHEFAFFSELEELGREINGQINLNQMITKTLECCVLHCQLSHAAVVYNDFATEELSEGISTIRSTVLSKEVIKILCKEEGPILSLRAYLIKHPSNKTPCYNINADDWDNEKDQLMLQANQMAQIMAVPIRVGAEIMGFLLGAKGTTSAASMEINSRIQHLANLLSSALSNAVLFHQLRIKNLELGSSLKELRRAEDHRDQFYRFLIHDLNKPLASIIGTAGRLLTRYSHTVEVQDRLSRINRSALRLRDYVGDMLDFEKLRRGEIELKYSRMNLKEEFLEIATMILERYPEQNLLINQLPQQDWGSTGNMMFNMDVKQFQRIIFNLLDNACKYGEGHVELDFQLAPDGLEISIWNDGPVIPVSERTRIFDEFYRRDREQDPGGSGIGLASVRCLVKALEGTIQVDSPAKGGNQFIVHFPNLNVTQEESTIKEDTEL